MDKHCLVPLKQFAAKLELAKLSSKGVTTFDQAVSECKEIIHEYRLALRSPQPVTTTGLMFHPQVYPEAYQFILSKIDNIGGRNSFETDLIFGIGYQPLLGAGHAFIAQIVIGGMRNYFDRNITPPEKLNFGDGSAFFSQAVDVGIGSSFEVSYYGDKYDGVWRMGSRVAFGNLMSSKNVNIAELIRMPDSPLTRRLV
jgi:hypothetical protein